MNSFTSDFASKLSSLPKWKEPAFQHLFVHKMSQHCCWKCSAHEGVVFIACIFTSPEANQSHALPNASSSFALVAFYSNSSIRVRTSSPFCSPCNGVQHSWNATRWDWVCRSMETWISPRQVCGTLGLIPLLHCPFSFTSAGGYPLQCQPGLFPTPANSAPWSSPLCNHRSNSVGVKIEISWSILQFCFQKEVVLEWSQHYI